MKIKILIGFLFFNPFSIYAASPNNIEIFTLLGNNAKYISRFWNEVQYKSYDVMPWNVNNEVSSALTNRLKELNYNVLVKTGNNLGSAKKAVFYSDVDSKNLIEKFSQHNNSKTDFVVFVRPLKVNHPEPGIDFSGYGSNGHKKMGIIDLFLHVKVTIFNARTKKLVTEFSSINYLHFDNDERQYTNNEIQNVLNKLKSDGTHESKQKKYKSIMQDTQISRADKIKKIETLYFNEYGNIGEEGDGDKDYDVEFSRLKYLLTPLHHSPSSFPSLSQDEKSKIDAKMEEVQKVLAERVAKRIHVAVTKQK